MSLPPWLPAAALAALLIAPGLGAMGASPLEAAQAARDVTDADLESASATSIAIGSPSSGRVAKLPLELYIARVLAGEAEPNAPDAAMQVLAIAIRTYATFNAGRHSRDGFDLCDTTHCQVLRASTPLTRRAALATAGQVLTYRGAVAEVFYSASCGGRSEDGGAVFTNGNLPYLRSAVDDVHDDDPPWTLEMSLAEIQKTLRSAGFEGTLRNVSIDGRNASGRVARLRLEGLRPATIKGDQFRMAVGPRDFKSTAFTLKKQGSSVRFVGRGYGHGVGLCVIGAGRRARRGESVEKILAHYYPGVKVSSRR